MSVDYTSILQGQTGFVFASCGSGPCTVTDIIARLIPYFFAAAGVLLLIYLLYGGISLMTAAGEPKKVEGAKGIITGALIGFGLVFTAYWLVYIVGRILGLGDVASPTGTGIFR
jgi:hypothetical protein